MPTPETFRACFYFCLELVQLMESVYIDLDLETNWNHPDNRGWMNIFRHWAWAPIFRVSWALSSQTFGARFVSFCENRVGIPAVVDSLYPDPYELTDGQQLRHLAERLLKDGHINFAEAGILRSDALAAVKNVTKVWLLKLGWRWMLPRADESLRDLTLGMAVLSNEKLVVFRIQDHVRRLGLGGEFMRLLLARQSIKHVHLPPGHYGVVGVLHGAAREALQLETDRMFSDALLRRQAETAASQGTHAMKRSAK